MLKRKQKVNGKEKSLIIGVLYRHPGNPINEFKDNFSTLLSTISEENKDICVIGDININLMNIDTDSSIKTYNNMLTITALAIKDKKPSLNKNLIKPGRTFTLKIFN